MSFRIGPKDHHPETAAWYGDYLKSLHWLAIREYLSTRRGEWCEDCKGIRHTSLHHITYARLLHEREEDLIFLCSTCHHKAHKYHDIPHLNLIYDTNFLNVQNTLRYTRGDDMLQYGKLR